MTPVVYTNALFWTGSEVYPTAEALAVQGGRIMAVGSLESVQDAAGASAIVEDLGGAFVMPGFIDNHVHFLAGGFQLASVDLRDAATPDEFAARIARFAEEAEPGAWILGGDWDHERWGGELPERSWIDSVTTRNPVFVSRLDGHMALANSLAMGLAGVTEQTDSPPGGVIVRDEGSGIATGLFKDDAMALIQSAVPEPDLRARREALSRAMQHAAELGVTQVHDVGSLGGWPDLETFRSAASDQDLRVRVYSMVPVTGHERLGKLIEESGKGDEMLWWGGLKGFVDGSLGSTTAWFYDPYLDEPNTRGLILGDSAALRSSMLAADGAGLHLAIHAIGDRANDWLLDVYQEAEDRNGSRDRRHRIEHAQHLRAKALSRFSKLGVIPSMQPYHAADDGRWAEKRIGPVRIRTTYPFRSLLDAEALLTFGSDWTVAPLSPLLGIHAAVTRQTIDGLNPEGWVPEQKIDVEEAMLAYTRHAAYAGFSETWSGTLETGKAADFVVLSDDLRSVAPEAIPGVRVLRTVLNGKSVYRSAP